MRQVGMGYSKIITMAPLSHIVDQNELKYSLRFLIGTKLVPPTGKRVDFSIYFDTLGKFYNI